MQAIAVAPIKNNKVDTLEIVSTMFESECFKRVSIVLEKFVAIGNN